MNYTKIFKKTLCAGLLNLSFMPLFAVEEQPNIIILFIDDLGYNDLGYRSSSFKTPNIDKLASEGIDFVNAYVPSPTSSPSRVGLLTGRHPLKVGFTRHIQNDAPDPYNNGEFGLWKGDPGEKPSRQHLPLQEETFAEALKEQGYTTCAVGKWHLGNKFYYPQKQGFDIVYGESDLGNPAGYFPPYFEHSPKHDRGKQYLTDYLTDCATKVIESHDYAGSPLCMYLAHYGVHTPIEAPADKVQKYRDQGLPELYAVYHAMVECIDQSVGNILESIHKAGVEDNTIVMFISDQGGYFTNYPLRGGKQEGTALYEGGAKVPFIVKLPGMDKGRIVTERISTLDVFPTLVELSGADLNAFPQLDGTSLKEVFEGAEPRMKPLYFYRSYDNQASSVIYKGYKFIYTRNGNHEMYHLDKDPNETTNLIKDPSKKYVAWELKDMVEDFLTRYEPLSIPFPAHLK
ncbi:sulfatase-like hydrolase/transferase [uncultured Parabacteroides sp.]|uniref:sulfatase-like hydrolase/transferase n=1 Tax=uncultured Parabacteroides sp. TaxID=512312 RepID=UPI0025E1F1EE|nr:sulfatase-like hydrolase/transferase [uncultured Parabacteroides sp.]